MCLLNVEFYPMLYLTALTKNCKNHIRVDSSSFYNTIQYHCKTFTSLAKTLINLQQYEYKIHAHAISSDLVISCLKATFILKNPVGGYTFTPFRWLYFIPYRWLYL